jgi:hypothetical protein
MPCKLSLTRWLMAITVMAVAVLLAPTQAQADCHRHHAESRDVVAMTTPTGDGSETMAAVPAEIVDHTQAFGAAHESGRGLFGSAPCSGSCHPGGAGCCAAWLTPALVLAFPLGARAESDLTVAGGAGVTPDALPEPPRFPA